MLAGKQIARHGHGIFLKRWGESCSALTSAQRTPGDFLVANDSVHKWSTIYRYTDTDTVRPLVKVCSLVYVVIVQSVFIEYVSRSIIIWYTLTTNSFAVVRVVKILNTNVMLYNTLRDVLLSYNVCVPV